MTTKDGKGKTQELQYVCDKLLRFPTKDQDGRKTQELQYDKLLRFPSLVFCNILVHSIAQNPLGRKPEIHRTVQDSAYIGMIQSTMTVRVRYSYSK